MQSRIEFSRETNGFREREGEREKLTGGGKEFESLEFGVENAICIGFFGFLYFNDPSKILEIDRYKTFIQFTTTTFYFCKKKEKKKDWHLVMQGLLGRCSART